VIAYKKEKLPYYLLTLYDSISINYYDLSLGMRLFNLVESYNCILEKQRGNEKREFEIINFKLTKILTKKDKLYKYVIKARDVITIR